MLRSGYAFLTTGLTVVRIGIVENFISVLFFCVCYAILLAERLIIH